MAVSSDIRQTIGVVDLQLRPFRRHSSSSYAEDNEIQEKSAAFKKRSFSLIKFINVNSIILMWSSACDRFATGVSTMNNNVPIVQTRHYGMKFMLHLFHISVHLLVNIITFDNC